MESWMMSGLVGLIATLVGAGIAWGVLKQNVNTLREQRLEDKEILRNQRRADMAAHASERVEDVAKWAAQHIVDEKQSITLSDLQKQGLEIVFRNHCKDLREGCRAEWKEDFRDLKMAMDAGFRDLCERIKKYSEIRGEAR